MHSESPSQPRVFGERMREIGQGYDAARAREMQAATDVGIG
jgi:hypothetical protein